MALLIHLLIAAGVSYLTTYAILSAQAAGQFGMGI